MAKKTWVQKMNNGREPEICALDKPFGGFSIGTMMLVSTPLETKAVVDEIPRGKTMTTLELREILAKRHKADMTCPLTTGIYLRILGEVALEELAAGDEPANVTPFWRIVEPKSPLAKKLSCGPEAIRALREAEGIR